MWSLFLQEKCSGIKIWQKLMMCNISKENRRHTIFFLAFHLKNCTPNVIQKRIFLFQILPSSLCSHLFSNSNNNNKNNHISMSDVIFAFVVRTKFNFRKYIYLWKKVLQCTLFLSKNIKITTALEEYFIYLSKKNK